MDKKIAYVQDMAKYINVLIGNQIFRRVVADIYKATPQNFFEMPASTSGFYHPIDERVRFGTMVHLKKMAVMSKEAANKYGFEKDERQVDILTTAALVHDAPFKYMFNNEKGKFTTDPDHATKNAMFLEETLNCSQYDNMPIEDKKLLIAAVGYHMGRWGYFDNYAITNELKHLESHPVVLALHEIDYYSSRNRVMVDYSLL